MRCLTRPRPGAAALWLAWALAAAACSTSTEAPTTIPVPTTPVTTATTTTTAPIVTTQASSTSTSTTAAPSTTTTTTAPFTTTTEAAPWLREVTSADPLRVWVIGDSLAGPVGNALAARGAVTGVVVTTVHQEKGTGLVRDDVFDWPGFVQEQMAEVAPDVVVTLIGANDGQAIVGSEGRLEFGTPEWEARYAILVGEFMDLLAGGSARVYWVGMPIMEGTSYNERVQRMNALHQEQVAQHPQVTFVEAYTLFQDDTGQYAADLPDEHGDLVTMRFPDGIHYTPDGADRMARRVLEVLAADWGLTALLSS